MICFYVEKADYVFYAALIVTFDTVGVWGSNPHAPSILFPVLSAFTAFSSQPAFWAFSGFAGILPESKTKHSDSAKLAAPELPQQAPLSPKRRVSEYDSRNRIRAAPLLSQ
jgi:hypothetical protein